MKQYVERPSGEPACLDAASTTFKCVATALATQLLPLSDPPQVHIIVINSLSPITPPAFQAQTVFVGHT